MTRFQQLLDELDACGPARQWVGKKSFVQSWSQCQQPDWLLWFAMRSESVKREQWARIALSYAQSCEHKAPKKLSAWLTSAEHYPSKRPYVRDKILSLNDDLYDAAALETLDALKSAAYALEPHINFFSVSDASFFARESVGHGKNMLQKHCDIARKVITVEQVYYGFKMIHPEFFK